MPAKHEIAYRNKNHTGWWVFREVVQWVSNRQKKLSPGSRCIVWENTRLVCASSREEAYQKALKFCREELPSKTNGGEWRFAGISELLPVYESLEDGAEILWTVRGEMTVARIKKLVKSKHRLKVFDDTEKV